MPSNPNPPEWQPTEAIRDYRDAAKKRGHLPYEWWLKPSGNLVKLAVMTTRNPREATDVHKYGDTVRRKNLRPGPDGMPKWIPWSFADCMRYAPWLVAGKTEAAWNEEREEILLKRRKDYETQAEKYNAIWGDQKKKLKENTEEALTGAIGQLVTAMREDAAKAAAPVASAPKRTPKPDSNG